MRGASQSPFTARMSFSTRVFCAAADCQGTRGVRRAFPEQGAHMGHAWARHPEPRSASHACRPGTINMCPLLRVLAGKAGPSIVLTISTAPSRLEAHILTSNLGWSRASQRSESQRRAVDVARVWPALLRGSSMEVLQRLGAQAPAERGHEGSRACICDVARSRLHTHTRRWNPLRG